MDALFTEELKHETQQLGSEQYAGKVGAFEGAMYEAKGYYRPRTIASCSHATRFRSARSAAGPSNASSTSTRAEDRTSRRGVRGRPSRNVGAGLVPALLGSRREQ